MSESTDTTPPVLAGGELRTRARYAWAVAVIMTLSLLLVCTALLLVAAFRQ